MKNVTKIIVDREEYVRLKDIPKSIIEAHNQEIIEQDKVDQLISYNNLLLYTNDFTEEQKLKIDGFANSISLVYGYKQYLLQLSDDVLFNECVLNLEEVNKEPDNEYFQFLRDACYSETQRRDNNVIWSNAEIKVNGISTEQINDKIMQEGFKDIDDEKPKAK